MSPATSASSQAAVSPPDDLWAAVTCAPADAAWCEWLYFTLNGFPVPEALDTHATTHGFPLPRALTVFPDPEEPEHAGGYPRALQSARYLIVICSPRSARCAEMETHIRAFKAGGGEERIIALVVEGEPDLRQPHEIPTREWLPPWLRWRLGEDGSFAPADSAEPFVVDARPDRASLDEVMAALLAALLDVPAGQFDCLTLPVPATPRPAEPFSEPPGPQPEAAFEVWEVLSEKAPCTSSPRSRRTAWIAGAGAIAAAASLVALFSPQEKEPRDASARIPSAAELPIEQAAPSPAARATPMAERESPGEMSESPKPAAPSALEAELLLTEATPAVSPREELAPAPADVAGPPAALPPPPAPDPIDTLRREADDLRSRAERLARSSTMGECLSLYRLALQTAHRHAAARSGDASVQLDFARLCLTVGGLQAAYESSAEARQTLLLGQKALSRARGGKTHAKERARLLDDLSRQLRAVNAEIPRSK
jgi:hypothetical protein